MGKATTAVPHRAWCGRAHAPDAPCVGEAITEGAAISAWIVETDGQVGVAVAVDGDAMLSPVEAGGFARRLAKLAQAAEHAPHGKVAR